MNHAPAEIIGFSLFMAFVVLWRAWETFRKQGAARGSTSMRWSFYALVALTSVVFAGTALEFFFVDRPYRRGVAMAGVVLFGLANALRIAAIRALDRYWSLHVEIREQHPLIESGPYAHVRHPAYAAFILEHIAVPLAGNAWWTLGVTLLLYVPMILWRIREEEAALAAKIGAPYRDYQRRVGQLLPCWRRRQRGGAALPDSS
jgi:protein-S-isoprenylcysteine O-methyltransferase Ste14